MKKPLLVKIPTKTREHIKSVEGNVIDVQFGERFKYKDYSSSPIVIGSNPTNIKGETEGDNDDDGNSAS